jgi:hypothetical protein
VLQHVGPTVDDDLRLGPRLLDRGAVARHGPRASSDARRKIAARSSRGIRDQSSHASAAAAIACATSRSPAQCDWASGR